MSNYTTLRAAVAKIAALRDFEGNSLSARTTPADHDGAIAVYTVYSYRTEIARFVPGEGWTLNPERYSVTTSRHQGIVRQAIAQQEAALQRIAQRKAAAHAAA